MDLFTGVGVALVTLLDDAGGVDLVSTGSLAADLADRGMRAVLACGTTGEPAHPDRRRAGRGHPHGARLGAGRRAGAGRHRRRQRGAGGGAHQRRRRGRRGRGAGLAAAGQRGPGRLLHGRGQGRRRPAGARLPHPVDLVAGHPGRRAGRTAGGRAEGLLGRSQPAAGRGRALPGPHLRGFVGAASPGRAARRRGRDPGHRQRRTRAVLRRVRRGRRGPAQAHRRSSRHTGRRAAGAEADPGGDRAAPTRPAAPPGRPRPATAGIPSPGPRRPVPEAPWGAPGWPDRHTIPAVTVRSTRTGGSRAHP